MPARNDGEQKLLDQLERELEPVKWHDTPPGPLFHYTNAAGLLGILRSRQLWATHVRYLNDREELLLGERTAQEEAEKLAGEFPDSTARGALVKEFARAHEELRLSKVASIYVASLSERGDQLSQWRAYGADGAGYAIGFRNFVLPDSKAVEAQASLALMRCEYDIDAFRKTIRSSLLESADAFDRYYRAYARDVKFGETLGFEAVAIALRRVAIHIPRLKHAAFSEEREWRLIMAPAEGHEESLVQFRSTAATGIVPYLEAPMAVEGAQMDLAAINVGPSHDPEAGILATRLLLRSEGYDNQVVVAPSAAPYRAEGGSRR